MKNLFNLKKNKKNDKKSLFITFEGGEGVGKTTQCAALKKRLETLGYSVLLTREPGATALGQKIRKILLHSSKIPPIFELLLYEVDRADHVMNVIRPNLHRGTIVICDRFTDATLAYQGFARDLPHTLIKTLNQLATAGLKPDITFLFDLPPELGLKRTQKRAGGPDRLEREKIEFHQKVREGYLTLARKEPKRFRVIDVRKSKQHVFRKICEELEKFGLPLRGSASIRKKKGRIGSR